MLQGFFTHVLSCSDFNAALRLAEQPSRLVLLGENRLGGATRPESRGSHGGSLPLPPGPLTTSLVLYFHSLQLRRVLEDSRSCLGFIL